MPRVKKDLHDWSSLNSWLYSKDIKHEQIKENFFYSVLVDYFPGSNGGSHRIPTKDEIESDRVRLIKTIKIFNPEIVVETEIRDGPGVVYYDNLRMKQFWI